jgi:UDP-N-acetylmuramoyl-L-alanyl-D-glutamate--2,6-diaminopimelate ligase
MKIKDLIKDLPQAEVWGDVEHEVQELHYDSRKVTPGSLFFCIKGFKFDGHSFASQAVSQGATALVVEEAVGALQAVTVIKVPDARKAMALMAAAFYAYPFQALKLIGVTGTNGKSTITYMLDEIFKAAGFATGIIGTLKIMIKGEALKTEHTTPEALDLQILLARMREAGVQCVNMEVSSHSLVLDRVLGCRFDAAVFSNLTQDHLDFHKDINEYFEAKLKLFKYLKPGGQGIINKDESFGEKILALHPDFLGYATEKFTDIMAEDLICAEQGSRFNLVTPWGSAYVNLKVMGKFNVYNALAAAGAALSQGISLDAVCCGLESFTGIKGRFESLKLGQDFLVLVDYAHTPDALHKVLLTAREITRGKLICVFGCGGDRDAKKRPLMGEAAVRNADRVIITSDNPRTEDPLKIIYDIEQGIKDSGSSYLIEPDRRKAIYLALSQAGTGDCVVIAGKGHEDYQILKTGTIPFDDAEVVREFFLESRDLKEG